MCSTVMNRSTRGRGGFTLVEMLLSVSILAMVTTVAAMTLYAASKAWSRGTSMTDGLHHGDYVMEQLVMALRSAYYPDQGNGGTAASPRAGGARVGKKPSDPSQYGFYHEDSGDGPGARDVISWVKIGGALVGGRRYAETPHRVEFSVLEGEAGPEAMVKAWQAALLDEDFDSEDIDPVAISTHVLGFDCQVSSEYDEETGEIEWEDEWEDTNSIPLFVQVTLYVTGPSEDEPMELVRLVELPCGPLAPKK
jgi:prepilin-type N-terminal cleavage/methylation domain-containing protein